MNSEIDRQLFAWVSSQIEAAQKAGEFCKLTIHIEGGRVVRSEKNQTFLPPEAGRRAYKTPG